MPNLARRYLAPAAAVSAAGATNDLRCKVGELYNVSGYTESGEQVHFNIHRAFMSQSNHTNGDRRALRGSGLARMDATSKLQKYY